MNEVRSAPYVRVDNADLSPPPTFVFVFTKILSAAEPLLFDKERDVKDLFARSWPELKETELGAACFDAEGRFVQYNFTRVRSTADDGPQVSCTFCTIGSHCAPCTPECARLTD